MRLVASARSDVRLNLFLRGCIEQLGSVHTDVAAALDEVARLLELGQTSEGFP